MSYIINNVKLNLSLYLINEAPRHKDVRESRGIAPTFLISALDGGEWTASLPGRFYLRIGGWVGPRTGEDTVEKNLASGGNRTPAFHLVARRFPTELSRFLIINN
jgi:hypothetical protein